MTRRNRSFFRPVQCAFRTIAVLLAVASGSAASAATPLDGVWAVDLTSNPGEPYFKAMALDLRPDGRVVGRFYDSEIEAGRWKASRGRLCVSFRTTDGNGPYHSSACLAAEDTVQGQTWAEHRAFLFIWTAKRPDPTAVPAPAPVGGPNAR